MGKLRYFTAVMLVLIFPFVFTACASQPSAEGEELTPIVLGEVAHSIFYAPLYAALSQGFFEEEGLEIDLINLNGADKVMSSLISGEIQIGLMGPEASVYIANQDLDNYAINFAQLTKRDGSFFVGREPIENFSFDKLSDAEIIGGRMGGVPEMTLEYVLKTNGLTIGIDDESADINVRTDIQFAAMAGSFLAGEGDYVTLFEPTATALAKEGKGYILASVGQYSGEIPYTAFSASKNYIQANPQVIQAFTDALYKGQIYVHNTPSDVVADDVLPHFSDMTKEDVIVVLDQYKAIDAWCTTPYFKQEGLEKLMDVMALAGQLEKRADFDKIVDNTFAEKSIENVQ